MTVRENARTRAAARTTGALCPNCWLRPAPPGFQLCTPCFFRPERWRVPCACDETGKENGHG